MRSSAMAIGLPAIAVAVVMGVRTLDAGSGGRAASSKRPAPAHAGEPAPAHAVSAPAGAGGCRRPPALIGTVAVTHVAARVEPRAASPAIATFGRTSVAGGPQVFLLRGRQAHGWYRALLPVRPNGTEGWVPAAALRLSSTPYHLAVDRDARRLRLWRGCDLVETVPVAVGAPATPTPAGRAYLTALVRPPARGTAYGPYAFGLSVFSSVIRSWRWGGVIGLHGTNDPRSIGRAASHGCIRMRNADIVNLARLLPLGTPVVIR